MTTMQRIRSIRLMEKMEQACSNVNTHVGKAEDGTMEYKDKNNKVLIEVKMKRS